MVVKRSAHLTRNLADFFTRPLNKVVDSYHHNLLPVTFQCFFMTGDNFELPFNTGHLFVELILKKFSISFMRDVKYGILYQSQ